MDWSLLFQSYGAIFTSLQVILMALLGATGGVLLGAVPGMTATMGVALLIPFSFGMDLIICCWRRRSRGFNLSRRRMRWRFTRCSRASAWDCWMKKSICRLL